jgi:hypothetical protein
VSCSWRHFKTSSGCLEPEYQISFSLVQPSAALGLQHLEGACDTTLICPMATPKSTTFRFVGLKPKCHLFRLDATRSLRHNPMSELRLSHCLAELYTDDLARRPPLQVSRTCCSTTWHVVETSISSPVSKNATPNVLDYSRHS